MSGGWHVIWSLLVLIGFTHMIKPVYFVKPFDPMAAVVLVVIIVGDWIHLWLHRRHHLEPVASVMS